MKSPLLMRLEQIEALDYEFGIDAEALDIMDAFATGSNEIDILVENYAASRSVNIAGYLAFLLSMRAANPTPELVTQLFSFLEKCRFKYDPSVLQCCLKALWLLLMYNCTWQPSSRPPAVLLPFLQRALDYSYPLNVSGSVLRWAVQVISSLYEENLLIHVMNTTQLTWLREKLVNLSARKLSLLEGELSWLPDFIAQDNLFVHSPLLTHLDQLEQASTADAGKIDLELFRLMETFAQTPDKLMILIERYGDSASKNCVVTLASLVSRMSEFPEVNTTHIIFSLTAKIRTRDLPLAFANSLIAMRQQILYNNAWQPDTQPSTILYPFLQHSLTYPSSLANYEALSTITLLCSRNLLKFSASSSQLSILFESAVQAYASLPEDLQDVLIHTTEFNLLELATCLNAS